MIQYSSHTELDLGCTAASENCPLSKFSYKAENLPTSAWINPEKFDQQELCR
jgi:hypothetical protein